MERVDLADFLLIAEFHTGIDARQLARIDRVVQLAESALAAPFAGYGDFELYPTLADKAAIYASRIARNHPLPDGNKRTAYDVMVEFTRQKGPQPDRDPAPSPQPNSQDPTTKTKRAARICTPSKVRGGRLALAVPTTPLHRYATAA